MMQIASSMERQLHVCGLDMDYDSQSECIYLKSETAACQSLVANHLQKLQLQHVHDHYHIHLHYTDLPIFFQDPH